MLPATAQRQPGTAVADDPARERREHDGHRRHRQRQQPRVQSREAANLWQIKGIQEQESGQCRGPGDGDQGRSRERRTPEEPQIQQRLRPAPLVQHQAGQSQYDEDETADDQRRTPAGATALDDPVGESDQQHHHQQLSDRVDAARLGRPRLRHEECRQDQRGDGDRHVDPEDVAPARRVDQRPADDRADRSPSSRRRRLSSVT
jgi:hypothetical protein